MATAPVVSTGGNRTAEARLALEKKFGILHFTSPVDFGWHGDIRRRYTDFIVHEVRKDGTVVYLTDSDVCAVPKPREGAKKGDKGDTVKTETQPEPASQPKAEEVEEKPEVVETPPIDVDSLVALVGPDVSKQLQDAYAAIISGGTRPSKFTIAICQDRSKRGHYHQEIRRIFDGRFETRADGETGAIIAMPAAGSAKPRTGSRNAPNSSNASGREGRGRNGGKSNRDQGKYVHFTMYKENKDTMEAVGYIGRLLKIKMSNFGFAGTKDRRAATTQRVSVFYHGNENFGWMNARSRFIKIGDFSRSKNPIQLGQHGGNDFVIAVKGVEHIRGAGCSLAHRLRMTEMCVQSALDHIYQHGFINYFGLQRFGTRTIGTQEIGQKILSLDFQGACDALLDVEPELAAALDRPDPELFFQPDEVNRARAIRSFKETGSADSALEIMPRRFSAEYTILQHLGRKNGANNDYCGALCRIPRGLRILYIHAYQSLVWNWAASQRWSRHGDRVIAGDLVLVESEANPSRLREGQGLDMAEDLNQDEEQFYQEARVLSAEEATSGQYSIFDIVLPVPGYDVLYPDNDIGEFYTEFMGRPENGSLSPYHMRRPQKEFSLSGHYRKIMARFTAVPQFFVRPYASDAEQMHPTDLDDIRAANEENAKASAQGQSASVEDESNTNRRRRLSTPDKPDGSDDKRVNDAWIEKTSDGGSKRMKTGLGSEQEQATKVAAASSGDGLPTAEDVTLAFDQTAASHDHLMAIDTPISVPTPSAASAVAAPVPFVLSVEHIKNLFKPTSGAETGADSAANQLDNPDAPSVKQAINQTAAWRASMPDFVEAESMEIAVTLNFRLSSSNYATMCLREMMTSIPVPSAEKEKLHATSPSVAGAQRLIA